MVMPPPQYFQYFRSDVVQDVDSSEHKKLCPDPKGKWITYLLQPILVLENLKVKICFKMYILRLGLFYPVTATTEI